MVQAEGAFVYIISNGHRTLYTGCTTDLVSRMREHQEGTYENAFTRRYNFDRLVYFEWLPSLKEAAAREKQIKGWTRAKRVALIESLNPRWQDLNRDLGELMKLR